MCRQYTDISLEHIGPIVGICGGVDQQVLYSRWCLGKRLILHDRLKWLVVTLDIYFHTIYVAVESFTTEQDS